MVYILSKVSHNEFIMQRILSMKRLTCLIMYLWCRFSLILRFTTVILPLLYQLLLTNASSLHQSTQEGPSIRWNKLSGELVYEYAICKKEGPRGLAVSLCHKIFYLQRNRCLYIFPSAVSFVLQKFDFFFFFSIGSYVEAFGASKIEMYRHGQFSNACYILWLNPRANWKWKLYRQISLL